MTQFMKKMVSKKKRRFNVDGFDLDLTYITDRIIAMGFPSEKVEGLYRNHIDEVVRFFDSRHKDHYKVYNLCSERCYDASKFHGRVAVFPFDDHNAPPFELIQPFCEDVEKWMKEDDRNVVVIHCKAGKGRTGVMIAAFLLHCKMWDKTEDALQYYGAARTQNAKGVTIPSQQRYVAYYGRLIRENLTYAPVALCIDAIKLYTVPNVSNGTCAPVFVIRQGESKLYVSKAVENVRKEQPVIEMPCEKHIQVAGDVKVEVYHKGFKKEKMFHFWFNTFFATDNKITLSKMELDKANKDKKDKIFKSNFHIEVLFSPPSGAYRPPGMEKRASSIPQLDRLKVSDKESASEPQTDADDDLSSEEDEDEWNEDHK
eukprot:Opistho-2@13977